MAFRVGDPVHAVKAKNRQNNLYPGVVVKVRSLADNTSEPIGIFKMCCRNLYHCVTCGLCRSETFYYDVHFTTGEVEDRIPGTKVFAAPIEQPRWFTFLRWKFRIISNISECLKCVDQDWQPQRLKNRLRGSKKTIQEFSLQIIRYEHKWSSILFRKGNFLTLLEQEIMNDISKNKRWFTFRTFQVGGRNEG